MGVGTFWDLVWGLGETNALEETPWGFSVKKLDLIETICFSLFFLFVFLAFLAHKTMVNSMHKNDAEVNLFILEAS